MRIELRMLPFTSGITLFQGFFVSIDKRKPASVADHGRCRAKVSAAAGHQVD
jgi:hypothetical protein